MPNYNTHRIFNYAVFIITSVLLYYILDTPIINVKQFVALGAGYYIGTDFITPDLDIKSKAIKRWGVLRILWLPYMRLWKHGQSSHNILYGAIVRILYISLIILGIYYLLFRSLPPETIFSSIYVYIFLIGIIISNALHIILDIFF